MKQVDDYMEDGIDCGCVLHGEYYTLDYAKKLEAGLRRNFSCPIRFHIWTEKAREVPKGWHKHSLKDLGVKGPKKGWWYKTQIFRNKDFQGRLFYFDLDIIISGNLDWMLRLSSEPVIASKPVANTMTSSSCSAPDWSRMPVSVISAIGSERTSTSATLSRL